MHPPGQFIRSEFELAAQSICSRQREKDYVMHSTCAAPKRPSLSVDDLMDTPLPDLMARLDVELCVRRVEDPSFCGYIIAHGDRVSSVVVSSAWSDLVQDSMARAMLGVALRVPLPALPEPFTVTEL